jgi:hypothetical protein
VAPPLSRVKTPPGTKRRALNNYFGPCRQKSFSPDFKVEPGLMGCTKASRLYLSVRKVVPTLTSNSAEIYLSMAGAKQLGDTGFILVPAGAVRPAVVCSRHCIALHRGACRWGLQVRRERRPGLQVLYVF